MRIGTAVTTRNRHEMAHTCVENLKKNSLVSKIVVVDDNSEVPFSHEDTEVYRFSHRVGVATAKNKCLELLSDCEHVFLFDDDTWPIQRGWEEAYLQAARDSGSEHMCLCWEETTKGIKCHALLNSVEVRRARLVDVKGELLDFPPVEDIKVFTELFPSPWERYMEEKHGGLSLHELLKEKLSSSLDFYYQVKWEVQHRISSYEMGSGSMMYLSRKVLERTGGFDVTYPMYGGEHIDFSRRVYNSGLNTFGTFVDYKGPEEFFYARDMHLSDLESVSSVSREEIFSNMKIYEEMLEKRRRADWFVPYLPIE